MDHMRQYEEIDKHIQACASVVKSAGGISSEWIGRAEGALGVPFPPSFRHYLSTYGSMTIGGEVVNGLLGLPFEEACGPDVVYNTLLDRSQYGLEPSQLVLIDNDGDEVFYLDTSRADEAGESPVVRVLIEQPAERQPYANSFAEFLLKRIEFFLKGRDSDHTRR